MIGNKSGVKMGKLYYNGKIITMAEPSEAQKLVTEAVYVSDGYIRKVGSMEMVCKDLPESTEYVDLQGQCLMPSFIDAHSHIVMNGQMSQTVDLSECNSFQDIIDKLKSYIAEHGITQKDIVIGYGYDHNFLKEQRHPDKYVLNQSDDLIPIMITHISGHLCCVNQALLNLAGIDESTRNPTGGCIGRLEGSNEPDGYLEEGAIAFLQSVIQDRLKVSVKSILENMQDVYVKNGITTVQDGATTGNDMAILKQMSKSGMLKVDVVCYPLISANGAELVTQNKEFDNQYSGNLKIGGYKIILDGSPQGKSAWLSAPYEDGSQYCGYPYYEDKVLEQYVMQALDDKKQILAHCNGDAASEQFLKVYEKCLEKTSQSSDLRPVMIHCQTVRKDQLKRMAKINMIASFFVGHVWYWGDVHLKNLGQKRGMNISPVKDAINLGVKYNFHQDTPVTKPNMLHSIWCAVNRISRKGRIIGESQKISVYDALKAVTINAAYEYFEEKEKGSIEAGKKADMVILSQSPLETDVKQIKNIQVIETIKNGETVYNFVNKSVS